MPASGQLIAERARLYESVRTAHLERARQLEPAAILYRVRRYDFDEDLAIGLELRQASPLRAARLLLTSKVRELEVNEPHLASSLPSTVLALCAVAVKRMFFGARITVVTYAIGNADPEGMLTGGGVKSRVKLGLYRVLSQIVWRRLDRVAFGTSGSRDVYHGSFHPRPHTVEALIPALPAPRDLGDTVKRPGSVVFLGALDNRKGLPLVLDSWREVVAARPDARLTIIGKGPFQDLAAERASTDPSIEVLIDPPRSTIFDRLDEAQVLALPSQPSKTWREQVGLPIVEGLASGCSVVTTTETGLAEWLAAHGHSVLPATASARDLAEAIVLQIDTARPAADVQATLPAVDGRLAADRWLFQVTGS